jgi:predicted O-methyltransferase YrrM
VPWVTFGAIEFLGAFLTGRMRVFEYGCGGSTLYFARRALQVTSVEHDPSWHSAVGRRLAEKGLTNVELVLAEPRGATAADPADPDGYASDDGRCRGKSFEDYARVIERFPDASLDVVLIDGRARPSCLKHARAKVSPGGALILDNTERAYYLRRAGALAGGLARLDFPGPCPFARQFTQTTVWRAAPRPA